ncbi:hypothetical protein P879_08577 [Paragonimus westermani]|uniref:SWIM-type domain-containing protein n=1 Tax=Paragonimus westermani TaxID=34504 RepID=A0A8T0DAW9_9TREM|nr:hypothetical protein P879_08577 [Paragonimus westermani]
MVTKSGRRSQRGNWEGRSCDCHFSVEIALPCRHALFTHRQLGTTRKFPDYPRLTREFNAFIHTPASALETPLRTYVGPSGLSAFNGFGLLASRNLFRENFSQLIVDTRRILLTCRPYFPDIEKRWHPPSTWTLSQHPTHLQPLT